MKKKILVTFICILFLLTTFPIASAEVYTDYIGDVLHAFDEDGMIVIEIDDRPNVDITEVGYDVEDNQLTLQMFVLGEIIVAENFSYTIVFGNHSFNYYDGEVNASSSLIDYETYNNTIICIFKLNDSENISDYELLGFALEGYSVNEEYELWLDMVPDFFPPYVFPQMGAGRRYLSFGRGIASKVTNIHPTKSVNCTFNVYYEDFFGLRTSHLGPFNFTVEPNSGWDTYLIEWKVKPLICKAKQSLTIGNATYAVSGYAIGQWYFFNQIDIESSQVLTLMKAEGHWRLRHEVSY